MKTIKMGNLPQQKIEVEFARKVYKILVDPPVEIYRQYMEVTTTKRDTEEKWDEAFQFLADYIGLYNKIDKEKFKKSLTKIAFLNFIAGYNDLIGGEVLKNYSSLPETGGAKGGLIARIRNLTGTQTS